MFLPEKLTPRQVLTILRSSLQGDLWQLWSLTALMLSSWPMLRKCSHELRSAVSKCNFAVHPYCAEGEEPTESAKEKAALVKRAMQSMRPQPSCTEEKGFRGMVYDMLDSFLLGLSVVELVWQEKNGELLPRAASWVHPRHFGWTMDGGRLVLTGLDYKTFIEMDERKFLVCPFQSQSGSVLGAGMVRPIAWWWSAMVFNREWMLTAAQKFGQPFRHITYKQGLPQEEIARLEAAADDAGAAGWMITPEGTLVTVQMPHSLGTDNPSRTIKAEADKEVQMLFLGQTSTTEATPGKLGGDDAKLEVRRERIEELASVVAEWLTQQFAAAVVLANYGTDDEVPTVAPDFSEPLSAVDAAVMVKTLMETGLPFTAEEIFHLLNMPVPEKGDLVVQRGTLGIMQDPAEQPVQPTLEQQVEEQSALAEAAGAFDQPGVEAKAAKAKSAQKKTISPTQTWITQRY